ncbi:MAG: lipid A export permease/ATP-binding protein MsbA [Pelovirga sp.]
MNRDNNIYLRILSYAAPYKWLIALSMVASLGVAGANALIAYLVQPFIDDLIIAGDHGLARLIPFLVVGITAAKGIADYVQEYCIRIAGQRAIQDIRNQVFGHTMQLSMRYYVTRSSGNLMSRILNDITVMQSVFAQVLVTLLRESATFVALIGYALYLDWKITLFAFIVIPAVAIPAAAIGKQIKKYSRRGQTAMGDLTSVLEQSFSGIKVVKSFGCEDQEIRKFNKVNAGYFSFIRKTIRYAAATSPLMEILSSVGVAFILWYGLNRVFTGEISQGEMFSLLTAIVLLYKPLKKLAKVNNEIQKATGAAERVFEVLDKAPEIVDAPNAVHLMECQGHVTFDKVTFAYEEEPVLVDFSVSAAPGEVIALVGPSGAGKSTFIGLLNRYYDPQLGAIFIDGHDIRTLTQKSLHQHLALVDQETFLFNDTLANNIRYGSPDADLESVKEAAEKAYAAEFINDLPEGYNTMIGDRGVRLSGGQRQRISIARAILRSAPILLLDEATSALDTESEAMVQQALLNLMKDRTTFVIAHRLSTIMYADRILVLERGAIVEEGTHQELLDNNGLYTRLYEAQFRNESG